MWLLTFSKQNPNGETESWNIIYESSNNNLLLQNVCLKRSQLGVDLIKKIEILVYSDSQDAIVM